MKMNSKELRRVEAQSITSHIANVKRSPLTLILENIYDTYNIGGLFRLADGLAVEKVYLCGETETPPNNRIHKASCGTYKVVPWEYCSTAKEAIKKFRHGHNLLGSDFSKSTTCPSDSKSYLDNNPRAKLTTALTSDTNVSLVDEEKTDPKRSEGFVLAIEQSPISRPYTDISPTYPLALVVGNESYGVTKETLDSCDAVAEIPMWGINKSLNVIISAGIVSYHYMGQLTKKRV